MAFFEHSSDSDSESRQNIYDSYVDKYFEAIESNDKEKIDAFIIENTEKYPEATDIHRNYKLRDIYLRNGLMVAVSTDNLSTFWMIVDYHQNSGVNDLDDVDRNLLFYSKSANMTRELLEFVKDSQTGSKLNVNIQDVDKQTPLMYAVKLDNVEMAQTLIDYGADLSLKDKHSKIAEDYAESELMKQMFKIITDKYKGYTKSDMETIDRFFENPSDWSMCPVCLEYVQRSEGCMYMSHNCSKTEHHYHKKLYNKYKMQFTNNIEWCTICGRITNNHSHYKLRNADDYVPEFEEKSLKVVRALEIGDNTIFYDDANCKAFGGKGIEEKITRIRRFREYALELEEDVDKKSEYEALNDLIEEVWNSPLQKKKKQVAKILKNQRWNVSTNNFTRSVKRGNFERIYKDIIPPESRRPPTTFSDLTLPCVINGSDTEERNHKLQFHHKDEGGIDHKDSLICDADLETYINHMVGNKDSPNFGKCWYYPECRATLYPFEIGPIVSEEVFKKYIKYFNKKYATSGGKRKTRKYKKYRQKGGNRHSLLHPLNLDSALCIPYPFKKKTSNNK